jgi:arsenate reductase
MAEALFEKATGGRYAARSAGTIPAQKPHPEVSAAMSEIGIELEDRPGTLLTSDLADNALRVIGMGCNVEEACPALRVPLEDWELEDPKGKEPDVVRAIRDDIENRVMELVAELDVARAR